MSLPVALAIDLGATKVEAALVDADGVLLPDTRSRRPTGSESTSEQLARSVDEAVGETLGTLPAGTTLAGVGIGTAGPISQEAGLVSPLNLPAWRDYPLRDQVRAAVPGTDVTLRMDGLCITLAEHWVGAARDCDNLMGMVVSTGIGGGLILDGVTVSGPTGNAGHIGHLEVGGFEDRCACGGRGCVEAIASGPKTVAWARSRGWEGSSGEELAASYHIGDAIALAAIERSGRALGQAIAAATALVDLEVVAIGGGFSRVTPDLFDHIRGAIAERSEFGFVTKVKVVASALSGDGPLIGAGALVHRSHMLAQRP